MMLIWFGLLAAFWFGFILGGDEDGAGLIIGELIAIPTLLTLLYLIALGLGFRP